MTLVFDHVSGTPQIHAFIVGIGAYPFLTGGVSAIAQTLAGVSRLGQLTSPPISAVAFYNNLLLLNQNGNLVLPLGSVEFIGSEIPGSGSIPAGLTSEEPTRQNIAHAYDRWIDKCESNADNLAIFYFCGHGIEDGDQILLCSDFGMRPNNPLEGSFNFDKTKIAVIQLKVNYQLFFVDACRDILPGNLVSPWTPTELNPASKLGNTCKNHATFKAAAPNEGAFSVPNSISYFTNAIIKGLNGTISQPRNGKWLVTSSDLYLKINTLMEMESTGQGDQMRCGKECQTQFTLTKWTGPTSRTLVINCDPDAALAEADLTCQEVAGATHETRGPAVEHWELQVPAGIYKINATFAAANFQGEARGIAVYDPINIETICCQVI
jgi:hypothetical protein